MTMILSGDVGGTKTSLALFEADGEDLDLVVERSYPSRAHGGLDELLRTFLDEVAAPADRLAVACLGVAGPVIGQRVQTTNLPWIVTGPELAAALGLPRLTLVNDLEAAGHGIAALRPDQLATLNAGREVPDANAALIAAGTGLGEAVLIREADGRFRPEPSEGAHCDFAPRDEQEVALLRHLWQRFEHVSYERVVSGPGLVNVYGFVRERGVFGPEPAWLRERFAVDDRAAVIAEVALQRSDPACAHALDLFVSLYGAEAGNLALKVVALGGVYVGGGIAPKIRDKLAEGAFVAAFVAKGRFRDLLEQVPVRLILEPRAPLLGAARLALSRR